MTIHPSELVERIWARDHTVWKPDPTEISNRLGWLDVMGLQQRAQEARAFAEASAQSQMTTAVFLGMGGSSLAPEVIRDTFGAPSGIDLIVLDTTHPSAVRRVEASLDLDKTLFIVASKSGTTTETLSHMAYFLEQAPASQFVAITDPGSPLEKRARDAGFREVFLNPPDIGGRYSALSLFGMVPAALIGVDIDPMLRSAHAMAKECRAPSLENPGVSLGLALGEAALAGRDKCTLVLPDEMRALGVWIEQLIAESTGKEGKGIVPIVDELVVENYPDDRFFVTYGKSPTSDAPFYALPPHSTLGGEFFRWEFATAVAGAVLGINPFDQPNVEEAKRATKEILSSGAVPEMDVPNAREVLETMKPGDYIALQAYLDPTPENQAALQDVRARLLEQHHVATTLGFGPRFLHSTGQLHKGGPNNVVCIQVVDPSPPEDIAIPGAPYTFGELIRAQAAGDLQALRARGRRVARATMAEM